MVGPLWLVLGASNACLVGGNPTSSRHCRDARVYGHTTWVLHDMSTPPPPMLFGGWSPSSGRNALVLGMLSATGATAEPLSALWMSKEACVRFLPPTTGIKGGPFGLGLSLFLRLPSSYFLLCYLFFFIFGSCFF